MPNFGIEAKSRGRQSTLLLLVLMPPARSSNSMATMFPSAIASSLALSYDVQNISSREKVKTLESDVEGATDVGVTCTLRWIAYIRVKSNRVRAKLCHS